VNDSRTAFAHMSRNVTRDANGVRIAGSGGRTPGRSPPLRATKGRRSDSPQFGDGRTAPSQSASPDGRGRGHGRSLWPGGNPGQGAVQSGAPARSDDLPTTPRAGGCPGSAGAEARAAAIGIFASGIRRRLPPSVENLGDLRLKREPKD